MQPTSHSKAPLTKVPVYEIRLVQSRRPLRLAEPTISDANLAARAMHAMLGPTDREHFAVLFVNPLLHITGAHVVAIGSQHTIAGIDARTVFRAAITACADAVVLGYYVARNIMPLELSRCRGSPSSRRS